MKSSRAVRIIRRILQEELSCPLPDADGVADKHACFENGEEVVLALSMQDTRSMEWTIHSRAIVQIFKKTGCYLYEITHHGANNEHDFPMLEIVFYNPDPAAQERLFLTEKGEKVAMGQAKITYPTDEEF